MRHHSSLPRSHVIYTICIVGFIATIHAVLPTYSNSSFLNQFTTEEIVGFIYMLAAALTILGFLFVPVFLRKIGNYMTAMGLIIAQIFLIYGLTVVTNPIALAFIFILQTAIIALIGFCLDVFLEVYSPIHHVGGVRGMYMTTVNSAWVFAPFIGSIIIGTSNDYRSVYLAALLMLFPLLYLVYKNFPKFKDPHYTHPSLVQTIHHALQHRDRRRLLLANTILQVFYAWMVVYSPIYLHKIIGFSWTEIGVILTIMLLPFPFAQWPLGRMADKKYGEKEIMTIGFAILGVSTILLAALPTSGLWIWALALFITRVGAAAVEIMIETYFFKTVDLKDSNTLGFFRVTRPLAYFIAPIITAIAFIFTKDQSILFIVLGVMCLCAMIPSWTLRDTN